METKAHSGLGATILRQILYVSLSTVAGDSADLVGILEQSRHNNALDGITGLLWSDGRSFLQSLEGSRASIEPTFARIVADARHHTLTVLSDRKIENREFGDWTMAHRRQGDLADIYDTRIRRALRNASDGIRKQFERLISTGEVMPPTA